MPKNNTASTPTRIGDIPVSNYLAELPVEQPVKEPYNSSVKLQLCIDAHASYVGKVTQRQYDWARAGSIVAVDSLDAPYLLEKRIKSQSCCNVSDNAVFQEVD